MSLRLSPRNSTADTANSASAQLAGFVSGLTFADLPDEVVTRTEELFLDWLASALAGSGARPVRALENFCAAMGPAHGNSEVLGGRRFGSPWTAALVNAAASHVVEQDDIHNRSVVHPGTVVFPPALAVAQALGRSGEELITAVAAGYEVACRVGAYLGPTHYRVFHSTGTAGTLGAAAAVASLLKLDARAVRDALGSAGTQAAGLWEFLGDAADSKQLHTAKAAADGLLAAYLAAEAFTGAREILTGTRGMGAGLSAQPRERHLTAGLGARWAVLETSFKLHASCRHTHPCADALIEVMHRHQLAAEDIVRVRAHVYQAAFDVLGAVSEPRSVHQAKFSMGFVLALIAARGQASVTDFDAAALDDEGLRAWARRVEMVVDPDIEAAYPRHWMGEVRVDTRSGALVEQRVVSPKGDPENPLTRAELEAKTRRLVRYAGVADDAQTEALITAAWSLRRTAVVGPLLARRRTAGTRIGHEAGIGPS